MLQLWAPERRQALESSLRPALGKGDGLRGGRRGQREGVLGDAGRGARTPGRRAAERPGVAGRVRTTVFPDSSSAESGCRTRLSRGQDPAVSVLPGGGLPRSAQVRGAEGRGPHACFSGPVRQPLRSPGLAGPGHAAQDQGVPAPGRREVTGSEREVARGNGLLLWLFQ